MTKSRRLLRKGNVRLRPRARIVRAIGEDLISNQVIAVIELVKNAYDADAQRVTIAFEEPLKPGHGAVVVRDDGHGMSLEVLKTSWFQPATTSKKERPVSPGGRRVTGEKGLGRFAAARLADRMHVESIATRPRRLVSADFNWGAFRDDGRFLDQIRFNWKEFSLPPGATAGTVLRLGGLRDQWDETSLRNLRSELSRLIVRPGATDPFRIDLDLPRRFHDLTGTVTLPPVLSRPHYLMSGRMSATGSVVGRVVVDERSFLIETSIKLKGGEEPTCGPFSFEFRVWDRDRESLAPLAAALSSRVTTLRRDLNQASGISIYRDAFRVLPYGGPANDWLRLDLRRVQNPTMRFSNNQVIGSVFITADANQDLRDQTNREGLVESPALEDFKHCILAVLAVLEDIRYKRRHERPRDAPRSLFEDLDLEPIRIAFQERYPEDKEFLRYLEERSKKSRSSIEHVQQVIVRYRRLATLGQLIDIVLHDGRTSVAGISNESDLALRDLRASGASEHLRATLVGRLGVISQQTEVLASLFRRISPFGGRKRGKPLTRPIEALIRETFSIFEGRIASLGVNVTLPADSILVTVDAAEMQQIFLNLLDNSLYWLEKVPKAKRAITVQVERGSQGLEILFCDSGPGIAEDSRDFIFDPYFSTKPDGVGLGLTIAGEIATEYDGTLELVSPGLLPGANFRVLLRRRIFGDED